MTSTQAELNRLRRRLPKVQAQYEELQDWKHTRRRGVLAALRKSIAHMEARIAELEEQLDQERGA